MIVVRMHCDFRGDLALDVADEFGVSFVSQRGEGYYNAANVVQANLSGFDFVSYWGFLDCLHVHTSPVLNSDCAINIFPILLKSDNGRVVRRWLKYPNYSKCPYLIPHLGSWFPVQYFDHFYDESYTIAGDLDWILRGFKIHRLDTVFDSSLEISMAPGGLSRSWRGLLIRCYEQWRCYAHFGWGRGIPLFHNLIMKLRQIRWSKR